MGESAFPITWPERLVPAPPDLAEHESMRIGMRLPNGATIVASKREKEDRGWLVLAVLEGYQPYITWAVRDDDLEAYWGHYHTSLGDALVDFNERH